MQEKVSIFLFVLLCTETQIFTSINVLLTETFTAAKSNQKFIAKAIKETITKSGSKTFPEFFLNISNIPGSWIQNQTFIKDLKLDMHETMLCDFESKY